MGITASNPYFNSLVWHSNLDLLIGLSNNILLLAEVWVGVENTNYALLTFDGQKLYKGNKILLGCAIKRFSIINK